MSFAITGAAVGSALIGSAASRSASNKQQDAANASNALSREQYDQTVQRNAPFVQGGTQSFNALLDRLGLSGNTSAPGYGSFGKVPTSADVMAQPGYQFGLDEGWKGINNQLNAHGMNNSGAQIKAAARFNNNYATQQYGNAFNQLMDSQKFQAQQFGNLANLGQNAANNTGQAGAHYATQAGTNLQGGANAAGANALAQGNLWSNALNQGVSAYGRTQQNPYQPSGGGTVPGSYSPGGDGGYSDFYYPGP